MVDPSMFIVGLLEEIVEVVVFGDITLDEAGGRDFFREIFAGGLVDVTEVDVGSLLAQDTDCCCAYTG